MNRLAVLCFGALAISAVPVAAEPIVFGTAQLTTSGVFSCRAQPACSASGNSVVLGTGADAISLSFMGVTTAVPVSNKATPVVLGFMSATGGTFPTRDNPLLPIVNLTVTLAHTSPVADHASRFWTFGPGGGTFLPLLAGNAYFSLNPGAIVPPGYDHMVYTMSPRSIAFGQGHIISMVADVGVVPEPTTMVLVGLGLAGVMRAGRQKI